MSTDPDTPDTTDHTPHRPIRIPDEEWEPFGDLVGPRRRARVIRQFIRWYNGSPGAKLPEPPSRD